MENNNVSSSTQIPIPLVDPDKLPREKGWSYTDIATIVGNLYLESRKQAMVMDEQFQAILSEYKRKILDLERLMSQINEENMRLKAELERRNASRNTVVPNSVG